MDVFDDIYPYLPPDTVALLRETDSSAITEIRFTLGKPVLICDGVRTSFFTDFGGKRITATADMMNRMTDKLTGGSMYSVNDTLNEGFVTVKGGHRVGVCGTAVRKNDGISHIRNISSLCFRVCRQIKGCGISLIGELASGSSICNILIASPPGCGKTTVLRDLCRIIANGELPCGIKRVGIADERGEIAAVSGGESTFDVGVGSFVCDGYPKSAAMLAMLRSMSPDVIVTDEIGTPEDFVAVRKALVSGISVIATAHGGDLQNISGKFGKELRLFDKIIFLRGKGKVSRIYRRSANDY